MVGNDYADIVLPSSSRINRAALAGGIAIGWREALIIASSWSAGWHTAEAPFGPAVAAFLSVMGDLFGIGAGFMAARRARPGGKGNFPRPSRRGEWFPSARRVATGIFNSGTNIGALLTRQCPDHVTWGWYWRSRPADRVIG